MEQYVTQFVSLVDGAKLALLMVLITANAVTGIAASIFTGEFRLKKIADFLATRVLPYLLGYLAVGLICLVEPAWSVAVTVVWAVIIAALAGAILTNLKDMGINLPEVLAGRESEESGK